MPKEKDFITEDEILANAHIPESEILSDISITQSEIDSYRIILNELMKNPPQNRWEIMKKETGIRSRELFIKHLQEILEYRKQRNEPPKQGQLQTNYRIDGGAESLYTATKDNAIKAFESVEEDFGEAAMWEITEEWDDNEKDWQMIEENMIRATQNYHTGFD